MKKFPGYVRFPATCLSVAELHRCFARSVKAVFDSGELRKRFSQVTFRAGPAPPVLHLLDAAGQKLGEEQIQYAAQRAPLRARAHALLLRRSMSRDDIVALFERYGFDGSATE